MLSNQWHKIHGFKQNTEKCEYFKHVITLCTQQTHHSQNHANYKEIINATMVSSLTVNKHRIITQMYSGTGYLLKLAKSQN
jgi:hypothetical protein